MINKNKNGFTLVELLAVIVILAIILVIAVPKVMTVIEDSKKATLESTAKMIASSAEKQKVQNTVLGNTNAITCDSVAKINNLDYASCEIEFDDNTAKVTIEGKGKFAGLYVCAGTKTSAEATEEECLELTPEECFTFDSETGSITGYDISCGTDVVIPDNINGTEVINIADYAFENLGIRNVIIPNTVKNIGGGAFYDNLITGINIPNSVVEIESGAFNSNPLSNVYVGNSNVELENCSFGDLESITTHNLPKDYCCGLE